MLKVWMPFSKDFRNIGLLPYTSPTNASMSLMDEASPIGNKCGRGGIVYHCDADEIGNKWTIATWAKSNSWTTNGSNDIIACKNTSASTHCQFYFSQVSGKLNIGVNAGSSSYSVATDFTNNVWHHYAAVYDGKTVFLYADGELLGSKAISTAQLTDCNNIGIGCRSTNVAGTSQTTGGAKYLSDFRIYSHALHDWEIKKIYNSKAFEMESGLHLEGTTNILGGADYYVRSLELVCSSENDADGGKYVTTQGQSGNYTGHTIRLEIPSLVPLTDGLPYSFSFRYKVGQGNGNMHQRLEINDGLMPVKYYPFFNTTTTKVEAIAEPGKNAYSYNAYRFIDFNEVRANSKYKMWDFQIEQKDHVTPYTPDARDEWVTDSSVLTTDVVPHNIIQSGSSIYFNGIDSSIEIPLHNIISGGTWSINIWFYKETGKWGDTSEVLVGGPSGFELQAREGTSTTPEIKCYSWGGAKYAYELDRWNMVTLTRTGSGTKLYINGALKGSGTAGSMPAGKYFIGSWRDATTQSFKGYMRRFSVYTRELSADDVMNLYTHNE